LKKNILLVPQVKVSFMQIALNMFLFTSFVHMKMNHQKLLFVDE